MDESDWFIYACFLLRRSLTRYHHPQRTLHGYLNLWIDPDYFYCDQFTSSRLSIEKTSECSAVDELSCGESLGDWGVCLNGWRVRLNGWRDRLNGRRAYLNSWRLRLNGRGDRLNG